MKPEALLGRLRREHRVGFADHGHVVSALAQSRRSLKHLVHRAGVELIEFENLKNLHRPLLISFPATRRTLWPHAKIPNS
jgi:hypothetical protein